MDIQTRRPERSLKIVVFLIAFLFSLTLYACGREQGHAPANQTSERDQVIPEHASQPDPQKNESDRSLSESPQTSNDRLQEVNHVSHRTIEEVKADWEERLMAMPGVMGVGIGLTPDRQQTCIKVYVNRQFSAQTTQIPEKIEEYPVEVEVRNPFRAL